MKGRNEQYHPSSWVGLHVTRRLSPYVTLIFLKLGISANQCTALRGLLIVGVGLALTSPDLRFWVAAGIAGYIAIILDCVDGELARSTGTASAEGTYFEAMMHQFAQPYIVACMSIGLFSLLGGLYVVVIGIGAMLGSSLAVAHTQVARAVAWEKGIPVRKHASEPGGPGWMKFLERAARAVLVTPGLPYIPQVAVAGIIDLFVPEFAIVGLAFNARLVWLTVFAFGTLAAAVVRTAATVRRGIMHEV